MSLTWADTVACPWCGADVNEPCTTPDGERAKQSHRARIVLSVVGKDSAAAVMVVDNILEKTKRYVNSKQQEK